MRKIIDVEDMADEAFALNLIYDVMNQNPNQEFGTKGQITINVRNKSFVVIKNKDSYTIQSN